MKKTARVFLRQDKVYKSVNISNANKPVIPRQVVSKWQRIIDLVARILNVPSGLIMTITEETMQVFVKGTDDRNPYQVGGADTLGRGLYCETVIGSNDELLIEDARQDEVWKDNPDMKLNMISYYGLPIQWPDSEIFGTICVLDSKPNALNEDFKALLSG